MQPHYSQSIRQNATSSSGTSPLASYKEVPPPPGVIGPIIERERFTFTANGKRQTQVENFSE